MILVLATPKGIKIALVFMVLGRGGSAGSLMNELPRIGIVVSLKYLLAWTLLVFHAVVLLPPLFSLSSGFGAEVPWAGGRLSAGQHSLLLEEENPVLVIFSLLPTSTWALTTASPSCGIRH